MQMLRAWASLQRCNRYVTDAYGVPQVDTEAIDITRPSNNHADGITKELALGYSPFWVIWIPAYILIV